MDPFSQRVLLGSSGSGKESYWILYNTANVQDTAGAIILDSSKNIVCSGYYLSSGTAYLPRHYRISKDGTVLNRGGISDYPGNGYNCSVVQLGAGGNYVFTNGINNAWTTTRSFSDFSVITRLSTNTGGGDVVDSSLNIYGCTNTLFSATSSLSSRWVKLPRGEMNPVTTMLKRPDGNMVVFGNDNNVSPTRATITTINPSTGNAITNYYYSTTGSNQNCYSGHVDGSGNMYWGGNYASNSILYKLSSGGSYLWRYADQSGTGRVNGITTDAQNNVYAMFGSVLAKFNSSGSLLWSRGFYGSIGNFVGSNSITPSKGMLVDGDALYLSYTKALLKINKDDPLAAGTYGPLEVQNFSLSPVTLSPAWSSRSLPALTSTTYSTSSVWGSPNSGSQWPSFYEFP